LVYDKRIHYLQEVLQDRGLAGAILFYSRDIFYHTGTAQPSYFVVLPNDHMLFVRKGYEFARRECGLEVERIVSESDIKKICQQMFPGVGARERVGTDFLKC
jgi:Xaa-Pro aminopeptidase